MAFPKVSLARLAACYAALAQAGYKMDAKIYPLTLSVDDLKEIEECDCSGFANEMLYFASLGSINLNPEDVNSGGIRDYFLSQSQIPGNGVERVASYAGVGDAAVLADPTALFVAFIEEGREGPGEAGHVWFVLQGQTLESHADCGVDQRAWNAAIDDGELTLESACWDCYRIPTCP